MADYILINGIRVAQTFVPETFGRLTTVGPKFMVPAKYPSSTRITMQVCECRCGDKVAVRTGALQSKNTLSCGCYAYECSKSKFVTHGKSKTPEYEAYMHMIRRCYNPDNKAYPDYGGRGIGVFPDWLGPGGFERWLAHIGLKPHPKMTQNRKDNNGNYEPGNVEWATHKEQNNNRRSNHLLAHNGRTMTVSQWATETGTKYQTLQSRIRLGWDDARVLSTPSLGRKRKHDN